MTENEAIKILQGAIKKPNTKDGYLGQAITMAIQALQEVQQYHAIEKELKEKYQANVDIKMIMRYFIETIFKGEKHERFCILTNEDAHEWDAYKAIGTVEKCREAMEKQTTMDWDAKHDECICPRCATRNPTWEKHAKTVKHDKVYCWHCGQAIEIVR